MSRGRERLEITVTEECEEEQNGRRKSPGPSTNLFHFHPPTHASRSHQEILMDEKKKEGGNTAREEREWRE